MKSRHLVLSILVLLAVVASAQATVILPADLGDLAREARSIARGRVAAVESEWSVDQHAIETVVTLDVETYLKGPLGATVQFRVPGGTLGRYRRVVVGAPEFEVGERIVIFLGAQGPSVPYVLGLGQGVFRIVASAAATTPVVTPPSLLAPPGATGIVTRGDPSRRPMPLTDFEQRVRQLAGGAR
jgi:hypothetical protein